MVGVRDMIGRKRRGSSLLSEPIHDSCYSGLATVKDRPRRVRHYGDEVRTDIVGSRCVVLMTFFYMLDILDRLGWEGNCPVTRHAMLLESVFEIMRWWQVVEIFGRV